MAITHTRGLAEAQTLQAVENVRYRSAWITAAAHSRAPCHPAFALCSDLQPSDVEAATVASVWKDTTEHDRVVYVAFFHGE